MLIKASIIGASGYTGVELIRLLSRHPHVNLVHLVAESNAGNPLGQVYPHLASLSDAEGNGYNFSKPSLAQVAADSDVVFLALPHTQAIAIVKELINHNCIIIDLGGDFRLQDGASYQQWYQHEPAAASLLQQAVYGLSELNSEKIAQAQLIANPGCYPTASILGLAPLFDSSLVQQPAPLIIDAKSGISGAGRSLSLPTHFCEAINNFSAYQIGGVHRHIPEIEQELAKLAGMPLTIQFTPHLIPLARGLMATIYVPLAGNYSAASLVECYQQFYQHSEFVTVTRRTQPDLKTVIGTNNCQISLHLDCRTNCLVVVNVLDNLLKGAAGQAVQNMNLRFGLAQTTGLQQLAIYP